MTQLIIIFAALILIAGIIILINPEYFLAFFSRHVKRIEVHVIAVLVRFVIGVLFITQSDHSRYPLTIQILGFLSIVVAVCLAIIGRDRFVKLMGWAINTWSPFARWGGILAIVFGAFVIHAFT